MISDMKNILITGVGGPTPRSFVHAVKLADDAIANSIRFIGTDCNPLAYGLYDRSLFDTGYVIPKAGEKDYWAKINEIIKKEKIEAAVVLPEVERLEWAKNRNKLKQEVKTHLPDYNLAKALVNKYKLHENLADSSLI